MEVISNPSSKKLENGLRIITCFLKQGSSWEVLFLVALGKLLPQLGTMLVSMVMDDDEDVAVAFADCLDE